MFYAYGLLYRMMQMGIPAYWVVNPTKHASGPGAYGAASDHVHVEDDIDMWILHGPTQTSANIPTGSGALTACPTASCTGPVSLLNDALVAGTAYQYKEFPLRGGAFLIAGSDTDGDGTTDRAEFNTFWGSYGDGSPASTNNCGKSNNNCYDFTQVAMYEVNSTAIAAWTNWTSTYGVGTAVTGIPVAVKLNYKPPRIARVAGTGNVVDLFLQEANLSDIASPASCAAGTFVRASGTLPYEPVYCELTDTDLKNGSLTAGNFGWAWLDGGPGFSSCSQSLQSLRTYLTGVPGLYLPGNVMVNDTRIGNVEGCVNHQLLGRQGAAFSAGTGALRDTNGVNETNSRPWMVRYPTNLFAQYGDLPMGTANQSWESGDMTASGSYGYNMAYGIPATSTLKRLLTRENATPVCGDTNGDGDLTGGGSAPDSTAGVFERPHWNNVFPHANMGACDTAADNSDVATYARFDNNANNGVVFYLAGNNFSTNGLRGELRILFNSLIATPSGTASTPSGTMTEITRSNPIVPQIGGLDYIVQGTTVVYSSPGQIPVVNDDADVNSFYFPYRVGRMRARLASATSTVLFDAGCNTLTGFTCPTGSTGIPATRTIFTNTAGGDLRNVTGAKATFDNTLSTTMKALISQGAFLSTATIDTIISRVRAGYPNGSGGYLAALGGVDRSTTSVIQASTVAGSPSRPMMVYFGGADGMMHAVCAETNVTFGCTDEGLELWAFLPRKMLPFLRLNQARIDGSPRVMDIYMDPDGGGGTYSTSWRTILIFQTGMGDYTAAGREPAVYALDVTAPNNPLLLWEYSESAAGTFSLGNGLTIAAGGTTIASATKFLAWTETTNLGTSGPGSVITAIDLITGAEYRQVLFAYPGPRSGSNDSVVRTGIPGGVVPLDLPAGTSGKITNLLFNDIYGRTWLINPDTLVSNNGTTTPLFNQSADYYAMGAKPAIYETGGSQYAVFATGGYADFANTTWPLACCSSASGSSCDVTQPNPPRVCAQYNFVTTIFPTQMLIALKIDPARTSTYSMPTAACDTSAVVDPVTGTNLPDCSSVGGTTNGFLFRRNLGRDERGVSQALIAGTDIFLTTETDNVNRSGYGTTGTNTGKLYQFAGGTGAQAAAATAVVLGAGAAAASNGTGAKTIYAGAGGTFGTGTTSTTDSNVMTPGSTIPSRKAWLRTE
jgi:hypothetical protein